MIEATDSGLLPERQYDAILVDEAQMFPPTWFQVIKRWLRRPHGMLFLAADMTQNIYARFSWKQKGLDVRGHSRILRRPYRSSLLIAQAAYELVQSDDDLQALLHKDGDELLEPDLDPSSMRRGELPQLVECSDLQAELNYVADQIRRLIKGGMWSSEIAVLCLREHTQQRFAAHLQKQGLPFVLASECRYGADGPRVLVGLIGGITGQEFEAVFVCDLQDLFNCDSPFFGGSWEEFKAMQLRTLYTAMTRARNHLHLCYRQKLGEPLKLLRRVTKPVKV
jgi:superfamily I DNA/RNA helicase